MGFRRSEVRILSPRHHKASRDNNFRLAFFLLPEAGLANPLANYPPASVPGGASPLSPWLVRERSFAHGTSTQAVLPRVRPVVGLPLPGRVRQTRQRPAERGRGQKALPRTDGRRGTAHAGRVPQRLPRLVAPQQRGGDLRVLPLVLAVLLRP